MQYWQGVLDEVLQKNEGRSFLYTNHGRLDDGSHIPALKKCCLKKTDRKKYFLNAPFEGVHLTSREAETMFWLVQDYTLAAAACEMGLSARTVEFYVKNMKIKLRCANKKEMIVKVLSTNLLQQLESDGLKILRH